MRVLSVAVLVLALAGAASAQALQPVMGGDALAGNLRFRRSMEPVGDQGTLEPDQWEDEDAQALATTGPFEDPAATGATGATGSASTGSPAAPTGAEGITGATGSPAATGATGATGTDEPEPEPEPEPEHVPRRTFPRRPDAPPTGRAFVVAVFSISGINREIAEANVDAIVEAFEGALGPNYIADGIAVENVMDEDEWQERREERDSEPALLEMLLGEGSLVAYTQLRFTADDDKAVMVAHHVTELVSSSSILPEALHAAGLPAGLVVSMPEPPTIVRESHSEPQHTSAATVSASATSVLAIVAALGAVAWSQRW